jgi:hypothetical protein
VWSWWPIRSEALSRLLVHSIHRPLPSSGPHHSTYYCPSVDYIYLLPITQPSLSSTPSINFISQCHTNYGRERTSSTPPTTTHTAESDLHLAECPDFGDKSFNVFVLAMVGPDRTRDQVIDSLQTTWHTQNNQKKTLWDAQVQADQEHQNNINAQNAPVEEPDQANIDLGDTRRNPNSGPLPPQPALAMRSLSNPPHLPSTN